jgi:hypothetical protein
VHNSLIAAIRDALAPLVAPRYYIGLEQRTYRLSPGDLVFIGRPDVAMLTDRTRLAEPEAPTCEIATGHPPSPLWVELPMADKVSESFLEVRVVPTGKVITVLELLSPANKLHASGRQQYEDKRAAILDSRTSLVEVDLMRAPAMPGNCRILVSRSWQRPRAQLFHFGLREPIPCVSIPLQRSEDEPEPDLNAVLHALYARARYDLVLDYDRPRNPLLSADDEAWARQLIAAARGAA